MYAQMLWQQLFKVGKFVATFVSEYVEPSYYHYQNIVLFLYHHNSWWIHFQMFYLVTKCRQFLVHIFGSVVKISVIMKTVRENIFGFFLWKCNFVAYGDVSKSSSDVERKKNQRDVENVKKMSATEKLKDDHEQALGIENPVT